MLKKSDLFLAENTHLKTSCPLNVFAYIDLKFLMLSPTSEI